MYANMENNHLGYCTIDVPSVTVRLTILCPMFRDVFSYYILARLTDVGIHLVIMVGAFRRLSHPSKHCTMFSLLEAMTFDVTC